MHAPNKIIDTGSVAIRVSASSNGVVIVNIYRMIKCDMFRSRFGWDMDQCGSVQFNWVHHSSLGTIICTELVANNNKKQCIWSIASIECFDWRTHCAFFVSAPIEFVCRRVHWDHLSLSLCTRPTDTVTSTVRIIFHHTRTYIYIVHVCVATTRYLS